MTLLPAALNLPDWFNGRADTDSSITKYLVTVPTSTTPKPVHILNGFFHQCLSGQRAAREGIDLIATSNNRPGGWAVDNQQLIEKSKLKLPSEDLKLSRLRRCVRSLIGSDGAVFSGSFASFQLAQLGLVTSDQSHFRLGELAARLAFLAPETPALLKQLITRLSEPQANAFWALERLLSKDEALEALDVKEPDPINWWAEDPRATALASDLSSLMKRALVLSVESRDTLLGLQVLAYSATVAGLLAFAQYPGIAQGEKGPFTLLCEAGDPGALPTVRAASSESLNRVHQRFREYLYRKLLDEVRERFDGSVADGDDAVAFIQGCHQKKMSGGRELGPEKLRELYYNWRADHEPDEAMARTLDEALASAMGDKPRDWFTAVGRHCGLVGPRRGAIPRFRVEVSLIPTLVLAGVNDDDGESLPMTVWTERLASRFGLVFGPGQRTRQMVPRAAEDELQLNQSALAALLTSLGLARRYSDGVTEVLNPLAIWGKS